MSLEDVFFTLELLIPDLDFVSIDHSTPFYFRESARIFSQAQHDECQAP